MEEKIIARLNDLSDIELQDLALSLRNGVYSIVRSKPTEINVPEGLLDPFTTKAAYQYILDDPEASFECFALAFPSGKASVILLIGVYGVTPVHQAYFPLLLNTFGREFIMMSFDNFNALHPASNEGDNKSKFALLLEVREKLIKRIFGYYYGLNEKFNSVMAWAARNPGSPTRRIAEGMMFKRIEFGNGTEMYFTKDFQAKEFGYFARCCSRADTIANEAQQKNRSGNVTASNTGLSIKKLSSFYQIIVD